MTAPDFEPAWRRQIAWCDQAGSPFTARVLEAALADWHAGGALRELLPSWPGDAGADALPLRVAGALHAMALDGSDAALAALYPPRRPAWDAQAGPPAVRAALAAQRERVAEYLTRAPQTNEIGRSAVLLGGFAQVARDTGLPLATLEIGASAGLNQLWHRYRYDLSDGRTWGNTSSPVLVRSRWDGAPPALPPHIEVAAHAGCDAAPVDIHAAGADVRLASYVWPDQRERLDRLRASIALARQLGLRVDTGDALDWTRRQLGIARPGRTTVLYHSIVWQYLPAATQAGLRDCIGEAGARATAEAPLAWLALEPPRADTAFELTLTLWPGGTTRVLAEAHPHGAHATWR